MPSSKHTNSGIKFPTAQYYFPSEALSIPNIQITISFPSLINFGEK
jgi:hypothetical protein